MAAKQSLPSQQTTASRPCTCAFRPAFAPFATSATPAGKQRHVHVIKLKLLYCCCSRMFCSAVLYLFHTANMMCGWPMKQFQKYQSCFIPHLCGLLSLSGRFDPEHLLDFVFAEIIGGAAAFGSTPCGGAVEPLPVLDADSISRLMSHGY